MAGDIRIKYLGWSAFILEGPDGDLVFDPSFRNLYGARWAELEDYDRTRVICITHGHSDHYDDAAIIVKRTNAQVVSSQEVCEHLRKRRKVDPSRLTAVKPFERVEIADFAITAFPWRHREINFIRLLRADFLTSARFAILNLLMVPFHAPYFGYHVETPGGTKVLNYCEGFSNAMVLDEVQELGRRFETDVLLAGTQLDFVEFVGSGVAAFNPEIAVLFHPHEAMFDRIGLKSSPREEFEEAIRKESARTAIVRAEPMEYVNLPKS